MDKLAHYRAVAFIDELEKIAGYEFDEDVREYLYKEAAFNLAAISKNLTEGAKKVLQNPGAAAANVANKARMGAVNLQASAGGQAFMNSAMKGGMQTPTDMILGGIGAGATQAGQMFGGAGGRFMSTLGSVIT